VILSADGELTLCFRYGLSLSPPHYLTRWQSFLDSVRPSSKDHLAALDVLQHPFLVVPIPSAPPPELIFGQQWPLLVRSVRQWVSERSRLASDGAEDLPLIRGP